MNKQTRLEQVINEAIKPYLVRAILSGFELAILKALSQEGVVIKVKVKVKDIEPINSYEDLTKSISDGGEYDIVAVEPLIGGKG